MHTQRISPHSLLLRVLLSAIIHAHARTGKYIGVRGEWKRGAACSLCTIAPVCSASTLPMRPYTTTAGSNVISLTVRASASRPVSRIQLNSRTHTLHCTTTGFSPSRSLQSLARLLSLAMHCMVLFPPRFVVVFCLQISHAFFHDNLLSIYIVARCAGVLVMHF